MQWLQQGGFFIIPLLVCSVIGVAVIAERLWVFRKTLRVALIFQSEPERVIKKLREHFVTLQTIITISPMLGLLGTVTGLMKSFYLLGNQVKVYNPQEISLGISEALITTAAGLIIAVVVTVFYNYFNARLEAYVADYNSAIRQGDEV